MCAWSGAGFACVVTAVQQCSPVMSLCVARAFHLSTLGAWQSNVFRFSGTVHLLRLGWAGLHMLMVWHNDSAAVAAAESVEGAN
jgi:hypothetical protein